LAEKVSNNDHFRCEKMKRIGVRENLNWKPWFLPSNFWGVPVNFPIIQFYEKKKAEMIRKHGSFRGTPLGDKAKCLVFAEIRNSSMRPIA